MMKISTLLTTFCVLMSGAAMSISLLSCSRSSDRVSLKIQLPKSFQVANKQVASNVNVQSSTTTTSDSWDSTRDITSLADVNCYVVMVGGSEDFMKQNVCYEKDTQTELIRFGPWMGGVPQGGLITLEVPSGDNRKISLIAMNAADGSCRDFRNEDGPDQGLIGHPIIIAEKTMNLTPGEVRVDLKVNETSVTSAKTIDDCKIQEINHDDENPTSPPPASDLTLEHRETDATPGSKFGHAVHVTDLNNNGLIDVIVGDPMYNSGNGRVSIYMDDDFSQPCSHLGALGEALGTAVSAGHVLDDSFKYVVATAPNADGSGTTGAQRGRLIVLGSDCGLRASANISSAVNGDRWGESLAVGNVHHYNNIGSVSSSNEEILIGSKNYSSAFGGVALFSWGGSSMQLLSVLGGDLVGGEFGTSVDASGDLNNDGVNDVVVGAQQTQSTGPGYAKTFYGSSATNSAPLTLANSYQGESSGDRFGASVKIIADQDADGKDDILVGASYVDIGVSTDTGRVYRISGGTADGPSHSQANLILSGTGPYDGFGTAIGVTADKRIVVGSPRKPNVNADNNAGAIYIFDPNGNLILFRESSEMELQLGFSLSVFNDFVLSGAPMSSSKSEIWLFRWWP